MAYSKLMLISPFLILFVLVPSVGAQEQGFSTIVEPYANILYVNPKDGNSTYSAVYAVKVSSVGGFEGQVDLDIWFLNSDQSLNWFLVQPHLFIPKNGSAVTSLVIAVSYNTDLKGAAAVISASSADGKYRTETSFGLFIKQVSLTGQVDGAGLNVGGKLVLDFGDGSKMVCVSGAGCTDYDSNGNLLRIVISTSTSSITQFLTSKTFSTTITFIVTSVPNTTSTFLTTLTARTVVTTIDTTTRTLTSTQITKVTSTSTTTLTRETSKYTTLTVQETHTAIQESQSNNNSVVLAGGIIIAGIITALGLAMRKTSK